MSHKTYPDWLLDIVQPGQIKASDEDLMRTAIAVAQTAYRRGKGGPFGAIVATDDGKIVAAAYNEVRPLRDVSAHAEVLALRRAQQSLGSLYLQGEGLPELRLFTTCEPCVMCVGAIYWSRCPSVIAAARKTDAQAAGMRQEFGVETAAFFQQEQILYHADFLREDALLIFQEYAQ